MRLLCVGGIGIDYGVAVFDTEIFECNLFCRIDGVSKYVIDLDELPIGQILVNPVPVVVCLFV